MLKSLLDLMFRPKTFSNWCTALSIRPQTEWIDSLHVSFILCLILSIIHYFLHSAPTYHRFYPSVKSHTLQLQIQNVHNSFIHNNQKTKNKKKKETAQISINTINHDTSIHWMNPYNGILFTNKKEQNYWYTNDINESQKYYTEWRSHIQKYILQWFHLHEVLK